MAMPLYIGNTRSFHVIGEYVGCKVTRVGIRTKRYDAVCAKQEDLTPMFVFSIDPFFISIFKKRLYVLLT